MSYKGHSLPILILISDGEGFATPVWCRRRFWGFRSLWTTPLDFNVYMAEAVDKNILRINKDKQNKKIILRRKNNNNGTLLHSSESKGVNKFQNHRIIRDNQQAWYSKYLFMKIMLEYACHNWETLNGVIPP